MRKIFLLILAFVCLWFACASDNIPVASEWTGLQTKEGTLLEKTFKTVGKGVGPVTWWAGGYTWQGGYFTVELVDVKKKETVFQRVYAYGDTLTGNDELPKFKWWHSEQKDRIILAANRVYTMKLRGQGLAQPGAGWGLWLYDIGTEAPKRRGPGK